MTDDKVIRPLEIKDSPFPGQEPVPDFNSSQKTSETFGPNTIQNKPFPVKKIATELLSSSLNSRTRKILAEFQFTETGAIQIGKFELGVSGDIRISPAGIVFRNKDGEITIGQDAETGDAIFKGIVQAGTLISGNIIIGGADDGKGILSLLNADNIEIIHMDSEGIRIFKGKILIEDETSQTVVDSRGIKSTTQFPNANSTQASQQNTTSTSFTDISGASLSFTLERTANVLVFLDATGYNTANLSGTDNCIVTLNIDGSDQSKQMSLPGILSGGGALFGATGSLVYLFQLAAGNHTIKGRMRSVNGGQASVVFTSITYNILGT